MPMIKAPAPDRDPVETRKAKSGNVRMNSMALRLPDQRVSFRQKAIKMSAADMTREAPALGFIPRALALLSISGMKPGRWRSAPIANTRQAKAKVNRLFLASRSSFRRSEAHQKKPTI
jgi:hypothetical protein